MTNEILVIDDNSDIRQLITNILKDKGFEVREAANYEQAILEINKKSSLGPWISHGFQGPKTNENHWKFMHFRADPSKPFINAMKMESFWGVKTVGFVKIFQNLYENSL